MNNNFESFESFVNKCNEYATKFCKRHRVTCTLSYGRSGSDSHSYNALVIRKKGDQLGYIILNPNYKITKVSMGIRSDSKVTTPDDLELIIKDAIEWILE